MRLTRLIFGLSFLFISAGCNHRPMKLVDTAAVTSSAWNQVKIHSLPGETDIELIRPSVLEMSNGQIMIVGGMVNSVTGPSAIDQVLILERNPTDKQYHVVRRSRLPQPLFNVSVIEVNGNIFVTGGDSHPTDKWAINNPNVYRWVDASSAFVFDSNPPPGQTEAPDLEYVGVHAGQMIRVVGRRSGNRYQSLTPGRVDRYVPGIGWSLNNINHGLYLPTKAAFTIIGDKAYFVGGEFQDLFNIRPYDAMAVLDLTTNDVIEIFPALPRIGGHAMTDGQRLYIFNGSIPDVSMPIFQLPEVFDPVQKTIVVADDIHPPLLMESSHHRGLAYGSQTRKNGATLENGLYRFSP